MATIGQVVEGPHTRIEFESTAASSGGALLSFRETYQPGAFQPPVHVHAKQTERFTVVSGTLGLLVGGVKQVLGPGQSASVPPGTPHTLWNAGTIPCVHQVQLTPARRMEDFFVGIVTLEAEGAMPPRRLSQVARIARLFLDHENRVPWIPWFVFKPLLRAVAFLGAKS